MGASAPLIAIDDAPVPASGQAEWFTGGDGARLRAALFSAAGPVRGGVVLSPGRTEPIEKHFETVRDLQARGFAVLVHDWRGQGLSHRLLPDRLRGHAAGFDDFLNDHRALLDAFADRLHRPWIALGHSMGGALALLAIVRGEDRFAAAALSAPMLGVFTAGASPGVARLVAGLMGVLGAAGGYALRGRHPADLPFAGNALTHDQVRFDRWQAQLRAGPDLALGGPTWGWLDFALKVSAEIAAPGALEQVRIPVLLACAGEERLVINAASRAAAARLPRATLLEIRGSRHEILMETDAVRQRFWTAFDALADVALEQDTPGAVAAAGSPA